MDRGSVLMAADKGVTAGRGVAWLPMAAAGGMIVIAVALLVLEQVGGDGAGGRSGLTLAGPTAEEAYPDAAALAEERWPDAELATASGRWVDVGYSVDTESSWSFHFFSPSTQRLIFIEVSGDGAWLVRDSLSPYRVPTFSQRDWRVDSDEAIQVWWDDVGRPLVERRPDAELVAELRPSADDGQLVWVIGGVASGWADPLVTVVSATDGTKVDQE